MILGFSIARRSPFNLRVDKFSYIPVLVLGVLPIGAVWWIAQRPPCIQKRISHRRDK